MYSFNATKTQGLSGESHGRIAIFLSGILCAGILICVFVFAFNMREEAGRSEAPKALDPVIAAMDPGTLQKQISLTERMLLQLDGKIESHFPAGPAILIDSAMNQIFLIRDSKIDVQDKCSTGTGFELTDELGKRKWTFETPRGYFKVSGKVANPVWYRPDWAFIEEGSPIPRTREERAVANVLGDYAIAFGNGYFIHGTLYTRLLGTSVTHGCIRVGDETLKTIYNAVRVGTPIWIY